MLVMTYSEARQNLASFLNQAMKDGEAIIKRSDGTTFKVIPESKKSGSPFANVKPVKLSRKITSSELLEIMNASRASVEETSGAIIKEKPAFFFGCFRSLSGKQK